MLRLTPSASPPGSRAVMGVTGIQPVQSCLFMYHWSSEIALLSWLEGTIQYKCHLQLLFSIKSHFTIKIMMAFAECFSPDNSPLFGGGKGRRNETRAYVSCVSFICQVLGEVLPWAGRPLYGTSVQLSIPRCMLKLP